MKNISINEFITNLASEKPTPGGGSSSALAGAIGSALMSMVANLTIGKKNFAKEEPLMKELLAKAKKLQEELLSLMEEDTEAFNKVVAVFKMPQNTEEEKAKRKDAMQVALKYATKVPYNIMEKTLEAIYLHEKGLGKTNPSTISDTGVGVLLLRSALMGAWLNVKINLSNISDEDFVKNYEQKSKKLLDEGIALADKIYERVISHL